MSRDVAASTVRLADGCVAALRPLDPDAPWLSAWRALSRRPFVENLFFDADFALAAREGFGADTVLVLVGDRPPEQPGLRLLAVWPCRRQRRRWGIPMRLAMGWTHGYGVFGVPLLDPKSPDHALRLLLMAIDRLVGPRAMLSYVPTKGVFADLLDGVCRAEGLVQARFWEHSRAVFEPSARTGEDQGAYLDHLSPRRRRRLRQSAERLAPLTFESVRDPHSLTKALDDYIALEGAGWKGRAGTALGDNAGEVALLHASVAAFGARGQVRIDRLRRDGTTVASAITYLTGTRAWCLKISFSETMARDSPGALLLHRITQALVEDETVGSADSCAPPNFQLAETFWAERMPLAHFLVATRSGDPLFGLARRLEGLRAGFSRWRARRSQPIARRPATNRSD